MLGWSQVHALQKWEIGLIDGKTKSRISIFNLL